MEWILSSDGADLTVALQRREGTFVLRIGEDNFHARVLRYDSPHLTLLVNDHTLLDAQVTWNGTCCVVIIDHTPYQFQLRTAADLTTTHHAQSEQRIVAPLPGRIVDILVAPGANVTAGQPLCIIEAMKMQNEICAAADGVVTAIAIQRGTAVEGNTLLMTLGQL